VPVRVIPSHAAFPLANASGAAEVKEIRLTVTFTTRFYYIVLLKLKSIHFKYVAIFVKELYY
jgi:hypothetical protein